MSWFKEDGLRRGKGGVILRKDQDRAPNISVGDRFFDVMAQRWATLLRIRPAEEALGAPFESLYDGCERFSPFIASAMCADIGEVISASR
tara:strand:- start:1740 stop:2009 length:270 start_codon:yes stop_codon:yes gene_type:complete